MPAVLLVVGALLIIGGASLIHWPLGLIAAGALAIAAGVDLRPGDST